MAIIFTMYNIRRAMSIIGVKELISKLKYLKEGNKAKKATTLKDFNMYEPYRMAIAA